MIGFQKYFLSQEVKISNVPADIYKKPVYNQTRMWADAQRNGRPAEYRWCPLQKFLNSSPCTTPQSLADAHCWNAM